MCGICGRINYNGQNVHLEDIQSMMNCMKYRGPDDEGVFLQHHIGLGFVRLSIIDLSADGHQPMQDESGRYVLVFNGEIYNYIEIRQELEEVGVVCRTKTDSEVLLKAYIRWGEACLDKFNGMFAFVIYDKQENILFGARDRFGIKPFYYLQMDTCFIFASEIPALLKNNIIKAEVNNQVMFDFLVFNRTDQTEATFFKGIHKLQHGHCFTIKKNQLQIKQWYNLREKVQQAKPFISAEEYREYLSSSVGLRLRSDVPVGVCLSGGLDSSSIISLILKDFHKDNLNTFSAVYQPGEIGDESHFIEEYRKEVQNMHFIQPTADSLLNDIHEFVRIHAEPIPSTSPYAQYKVMQLAKGKVMVTLDGQGADEQLAGYHYFYGFFFKDLLTSMAWVKLIKEMFAYYKQHKSWMGIQSFVYFMLPVSLRTRLRSNEYGYLKTSFVQANASSNTIAGNLYGSKTLNEALLDHFEYKLEHLLKWGDRNSMASSIESRVPFLDYRLVEKTLATPNTRKIEKGITKSILREAMKGYLPEIIRQRKDKVGFETPQETWFRLPAFQVFINDIITSESFRNRAYFDVDKVKLLYQQHVEGKINISKEIWKWIHTELWCRKFIDTSFL
ncbi:MAG TPA: asparagine synthase (glutamine-hydrolyzing) [Bacteroidales bacterium]|nr:asparagine synthase (glutamine-hydrolyzing) [Bacteroidales bacterium]